MILLYKARGYKSPREDTVLASTTGSRVVWFHDTNVTSWSGQTDFWNFVNQNTVDKMVDQGLMTLTSKSTVQDAWRTLIPNYQQGEIIAIKVNFNNVMTSNCAEADGQMDALMQPVNSIVRGLRQIGVPEENIWVYDSIRRITDRFVTASRYPNIKYYDSYCRNRATFRSTDPTATVQFNPPPGYPTPPPIKLADILLEADYLINIPLLKGHGCVGVTLGFKNHYGSINSPVNLHQYCYGMPSYHPDYSPFVDLYKNPNILNKTVLTVGDAIYGDFGSNVQPPKIWRTFGSDSPKSILFSTDPVAIDSVMTDIIDAEKVLRIVQLTHRDYLIIAERAGLGVYEQGDPWRGSSGYSKIDLIKCEGLCTPTTETPNPTNTIVPPTLNPSPTPTNSPTPPNCTKPGDANCDGKVDGFDYVYWWTNFNKNVSGGSADGDFNNSGFVDGFDYVIWWTNFGK